MGYKDSDVFLFFIVIFILFVIFGRKKPSGSSAPPPPPPQVRQEQTSDYALQTSAPEMQRFAADGGFIKGVFVVITIGYAQTQLMALSLSTQVKMKGKTIRILLCDAAGELAIKGSREVVLKPFDNSPQMLMKALIAQGVKVEVCPFFLANKTATPADLIEGVSVAQPSLIADALIEPGTKLFTF
ncbi:MAG: hypothetical protein AB7S75_24890 [Desulfococcaceae bacterium]